MNNQITNVNCPDKSSQFYFTTVTIAACSLNAILFLLIRKDTHPLMKSYLPVLYTSTILDFTSALLQHSTQVRPVQLGEYSILTMCLDGWLPALVEDWPIFKDGNLNYLLIIEYLACYTTVLYSVIPFVFRYLLVVRNYRMSYFQFSCLFLCVLIYCYIASVAITMLSASTHFENVQTMPKYNTSCTRFLPQFSIVNVNTTWRTVQFKIWFYMSSSFAYFYFIIMFCMFSIWRFLHKQSTLMSAQNRSIQWQVSLTISLQSLVPFCAYFGPVLFSSYTLDFGVYYQTIYYNILFTSYTLVPLLNPLVPLIFVSRYRQALAHSAYRLISKAPGLEVWSNHQTTVSVVDLSNSADR
ncbi:hypothetical protein M3Y95_00973100 [Aphelenchoides besseyi]|nr:hypothetical protein M3Y95_00973100 [Aphelenchoides besseyi]